jgi:hypothetical protein
MVTKLFLLAKNKKAHNLAKMASIAILMGFIMFLESTRILSKIQRDIVALWNLYGEIPGKI